MDTLIKGHLSIKDTNSVLILSRINCCIRTVFMVPQHFLYTEAPLYMFLLWDNPNCHGIFVLTVP